MEKQKLQEIQHIAISDLVLWTENPRDPIDHTARDQDIVNRALSKEGDLRWNLKKLANDMGDLYDYGELPTVVYQDNKPVVYDGNRRMTLGKIKLGLVNPPKKFLISTDFPEKIPCNVCVKQVALQHVFRKHGDKGSWKPLERDLFLYQQMGEAKSDFLLLEEFSGLIRNDTKLNQGFVKEEVFKRKHLKRLGFDIVDGQLLSRLPKNKAMEVLQAVGSLVHSDIISTRGDNRGKNPYDLLKEKGQKGIVDLIDQYSASTPKPLEPSQPIASPNLSDRVIPPKNNQPHHGDSAQDGLWSEGSVYYPLETGEILNPPQDSDKRKTRRSNQSESELFGETLSLKHGSAVNDLYRDICDLYAYFKNNKSQLSSHFPSLIRMALRLLVETAAKNNSFTKIDEYIKNYFTNAKSLLTQDQKTQLHTQNVTESSLVSLLQGGAHNYESSKNLDQTLAMSLVIGKVLMLSHGK